ncbi:MAG: hypothetical protein M3Y13_03655 [Armatimonadota bacterium]|nr:hypothetical protein [Armatimonadota bacterium]
MHRYKTVVTDYEGMQGLLDSHAEQGWRLFSVSPDTWRKSLGQNDGMVPPPFEELSAPGLGQEYSASYYLLVFQRDDVQDTREALAVAEQTLPFSPFAAYEE